MTFDILIFGSGVDGFSILGLILIRLSLTDFFEELLWLEMLSLALVALLILVSVLEFLDLRFSRVLEDFFKIEFLGWLFEIFGNLLTIVVAFTLSGIVTIDAGMLASLSKLIVSACELFKMVFVGPLLDRFKLSLDRLVGKATVIFFETEGLAGSSVISVLSWAGGSAVFEADSILAAVFGL